MGVDIYSKNLSYSLGYGGFRNLRKTVGSLITDDELREHYMLIVDDVRFSHDKEFYRKYDEKTEKLYRKHRKKYGRVIDFLYCSDCEGNFGYHTAEELLVLIGGYDDNIIYGYAGLDDPFKFRHFRKLLEDARDTKSKWGWR